MTDARDTARAQQIANDFAGLIEDPRADLVERQLADAIQQALAEVRAENAEVLAVLKDIVAVLQKEAPGTPLNNHKYDALGIFYEAHTDKQANELVEVTIQRDKWLSAFNRSEQFQTSQRDNEIDLQHQLLDLIADSKQAARVELERLLSDYMAAADGNMDWYWVDQVENRIKALEFFPQASAATDPEQAWRMLTDRVAHRYSIDRRDVDWVRVASCRRPARRRHEPTGVY